MRKRGALKIIKKLKESDILLDSEPKTNYEKLKKKSEVEFLKKEGAALGGSKPPSEEMLNETKKEISEKIKSEITNHVAKEVASTVGSATFVISGPVTMKEVCLPELLQDLI